MFFRVSVDTIEKSRFLYLPTHSSDLSAAAPNLTLRNDKYEFSPFVVFYDVRNISEFNSFDDKSLSNQSQPMYVHKCMLFARLIDNITCAFPLVFFTFNTPRISYFSSIGDHLITSIVIIR